MKTIMLLLGVCFMIGASFPNPVISVEELWSEASEINVKVSFTDL